MSRLIPIIYQDAHLIVVDKPAGLTTVRHKDEVGSMGKRARFLPPTLVDVLTRQLGLKRGQRLRAVHRLDKETSGLLVLAKTAAAERSLGLQFRAGTIDRRYVGLV